MKVIVNGEDREVPESMSLGALLAAMDLPVSRVAVERNDQVIPRSRMEAVELQEGDRLELVWLVGGG